MGLFRLPWISEEWFRKYSFNYCDHFGDKKVLSRLCKICAQDEKRKERYRKEGKDPYDMENVLNDVAENFTKVMIMLRKDAKRFGIDIDNLPEIDEEEIKPEEFPVYRIVHGYDEVVEQLIERLWPIKERNSSELLEKVVDVLSWSRHYVVVKTARALHSKHDEIASKMDLDIADSKTSAFFAYMAIQRNISGILALARRMRGSALKQPLLEFVDISQTVSAGLRQEFFPDNSLECEEFGCEEYDKIFLEGAFPNVVHSN